MGEGLEETAPADAPAPRGTAASGGPAHDVTGRTLDGEAIEIGLVGAPTNTLLAFLSGTCYTCEPFWQALAEGVQVPGGARVVAVVQDGDSLSRLQRLAGPDLLVVASDQAWRDYQVPGSPHFVYVDGPSGRVAGEGTAATWEQISDLVAHANSSDRTTSIDLLPPGRDNPERVDRELMAAGIGPGHPSLYPDAAPETSPVK
jgi:hypothetical protein